MMFSRRSLQRCLDEISVVVPDGVRKALVKRLNTADRHRLAAMWELLVIHGLRNHGTLVIEDEKNTGRKPDITFVGKLSFVADITTVSDDGRDNDNPYEELSDEIERQKNKLGLPIGGVDIRIGSYRERAGRGERTNLKLPKRGNIREFVAKQIIPEVQRQLGADADPITVAINNDQIEITVSIKRNSDGFSSGNYAAYAVPQSLDRNPLFNALKGKVKQLKQIEGLTGIIVCDGNTECFRKPALGNSRITAERIIQHFLKQNSSIDFVLAITVDEEQRHVMQWEPPARTSRGIFLTQPNLSAAADLHEVFRTLMSELPPPVCAPINGARRALESIYSLGFHGGGSWASGGRHMSISRISISARELMELLAGDTSIERINGRRRWKPRGENAPDKTPNPFQLMLDRGHLPTSLKLVSGGHKDDDWIEIEFGATDAAIAKFR